ncbi:MAG: AMP-binding protein, partial [Thermodesulfobacteriota bacterium]
MPEPQSIIGLFLDTVNKLGPKTALRRKDLGLWKDISWREYADRVRLVAYGLMSLGLEKGQTAAICGENSPEWVFADLGIMSAGGVTAGIYTTNAAAQCEYVVQNSEARFYFAENEEQLDKVLAFRENTPLLKKIIVWDLEGLHAFRDPMVLSFDGLLELGKEYARKRPGLLEERSGSLGPEDLAVLIYTSGTTGPPKGAMLT